MRESSQCRCLNCLKRFPIEPNAKEAMCPHCKIKYRISWPWPGQPKIRGLAKQ
jgi:Zn finger protein HypA/HybF involved in hydrogenase expression